MHLLIPVLLSVVLKQLGFGLAIPIEPIDVQTKITMNEFLGLPHSNDGSSPPTCIHNTVRSLENSEECTKDGPSSNGTPKEKPKRNR